MGIWRWLRETLASEFRWHRLRFEYHEAAAFVTNQWGWSTTGYVIYRVGLAVYVLSFLAVDFSIHREKFNMYWPIYLTNWSYSLLCVYLCLAAYVSTQWASDARHALRTRQSRPQTPEGPQAVAGVENDGFENGEGSLHSSGSYRSFRDLKQDTSGDGLSLSVLERQASEVDGHNRLPRLVKALWVFQVLAMDAAVAVTIAYWGLLFPALQNSPDELGRVTLGNLNAHAMNSVIILADAALAAFPVRLLHVWVSCLYVVTYLTLSVVYYLAGGVNRHGKPYVYPVLNWGSEDGAGMAVTVSVVGLLVGVPLVHTLHFSLFKARTALFDALKRRQREENGMRSSLTENWDEPSYGTYPRQESSKIVDKD